MTKMLLMLPVALALLGGCAGSNDTQSPQASADCSNLSGAALAECQKTVQPASQTYNSAPTKPASMIHGNTGDAAAR